MLGLVLDVAQVMHYLAVHPLGSVRLERLTIAAGDGAGELDGPTHAGDLVVEAVAEGIDLVQSSITYSLTDNVENLTLTGSSAINGTGNDLNNTITGNSASNSCNAPYGQSQPQ